MTTKLDTVIYGSKSFIASNLLEKLYDMGVDPEDVTTVARSGAEFTYEQFHDILDYGEVEIRAMLYATGRPQPPYSTLEDNPDLFQKNTFDFFELIEKSESKMSSEGTIIYLSSGHSMRASDLNPYYAASKAAVNSFVMSHGKKLAKMNLNDSGHRRINSIAPEAIDSPMIDNMLELGDVSRGGYIQTRPNFRLLNIEEVVDPIIFLMSSGSTAINGTTIILGGVK